VYSKLGNGEFSIALTDSGKVIISKTIRHTLVIGYQGIPAYSEVERGIAFTPVQALTAGFTVSAVVALEARWTGRIFDKITAGGVDGWLLDVYPVNEVRVISNGSSFNSQTKITTSAPVYVAATYGADEISVYQNGVKTDTFKVHAPPQNNFPIRIGFDSNYQNSFPGTIHRARIFYSVLADTQVAADYQDARTTLNLP